MKILVLQFKALGDTVLLIPTLKALREKFPDCALHVLVKEEAAPILGHLSWLNRIWSMPRIRGKARIRESWPIVRALRRERFDRSVDFGGNDRGAILSWLCGARRRLGPENRGGLLWRHLCYTERVTLPKADRHETLRLLDLVSSWGVTSREINEIQIATDPVLDLPAQALLPTPAIICHLGAGCSKKQWPLQHWVAFHPLALRAGYPLVFTTGMGAREQRLAEQLKRYVPEAVFLPSMPDLDQFLAVLKRARALITGDTGPGHLAAALGVPVLSLFGPTSAVGWAPVGHRHQILSGSPCQCAPSAHDCHNASHCLAAITPEQVLEGLASLLARNADPASLALLC